MNHSYPKSEKLKSKKNIEKLFAKGKSISKYPLRLVYVPLEVTEENKIQLGVSVSKKYFKKAVFRNRYKRLLRETYRLNKHILSEKIDKPYAFMFFYQTKDLLNYHEINEKTILLFEKFINHIQATE